MSARRKRIMRLFPGRSGREQEIERELRLHIALREEELLARGVPAAEARRRAQDAFGDYRAVAEACGRIRSARDRERRRRSVLDALAQDVRYALRVLGRAPGYTITALLTLALGIGSSTAIFSLVYGLLLRPLPFPGEDRLVNVTEANPAAAQDDYGVSWPLARELGARTRTLAQGGAFYQTSLQVLQGDVPVRVPAAALQAGAFAALGVSPALGRLPAISEHDPQQNAVVLLSDGYWRRRFAADRAVVGRTLTIDGQPHTVIGVMPPGFVFPSEDAELWTPFPRLPAQFENRTVHVLQFLGRMRADVTTADVSAELGGILRQSAARASLADETQHTISVLSLRRKMIGEARQLVLILFVAIIALLIIACVNLAGLQLARGAARADEIAVRAALGAGRWAVGRQLIVESLLLGLAGLGGGVAIAQLLRSGLLAVYPGELPFATQTQLDARVLWFAGALTVFAVLLFGLAPTWQAARQRALAALRSGSRLTLDRRRHRIRSALVIGEVALAIVLVTGATLVGRSFARLQAQPTGFQTDNLLLLSITPSPERITAEQVIPFYQQLPALLESVPGVNAVSASSSLPISGGDSHGDLSIEGAAFAPGNAPGASYRRVLPNYFRTIGIPLLAGREFDARDRGQDPRVTIVNESLARRNFGSAQNALGRRIKVGPPENEPWLTIVGVVGDVRNEGLEANDEHATYEPHPQRPWRTMQLVVHVNGGPAMAALPGVRAALQQVDHHMLIENVSTMQDRIAESVAARRFNATILGSFGLMALFLAAIGVNGIIAFLVTERRREFGIRASLGATTQQIRRNVLLRALRLVGAGAVFGVPAALLTTRFAQSLLYQIDPLDAVSFLLALGALVACALLGAWWPARRASRLDPVVLLHDG